MADRYWKGANLGSWGTNSNWSSNLAGTVNSVMPTASDTAIFNASSVTGSRLIYLGAPTPSQRNVLNIIGNSSLVDVQLVGGTTSTTENVDIYIYDFNAVTMQAGAGPLTIGNDGTNRKVKLVNSDLNAARLVANGSSSRLTFNNGLTFFLNLTMDVTGTGNTYVKVGDGASNSTLTVTGNTNGGYVRYDSGIDGFVQVNSGWLQLGYDPVDNNNLVDSLLLFGGKLSSSSTVARSTPRRVRLSGSVTLGDATNNGALTFSGTTTIAGPTTLTTLGAGIVFSGKFTGNNAFSKGGAANLFLNGTTNDYSGAFTLTAGNLLIADFNLGTPNQLGTAASLTLSGGVCFINGNTAYSSFATPISGTADVYVTNTSSGGVTFTGSALSSYNGSLRLYTDSAYGSATVQKITTTALASSNFFFLTGGGLSSQVSQTLVYNGTSALAYGNAILILPQSGPGITAKIENASSNNTAISFSGTLSNNGTSAYATSIEFATTNANITYSGNITEASTGTLNLSKTGSNALTLSGSTSTYKGTVSVTAGTLNANSATALGAANSTAAISVTSGATLSAGAALNYSSPGRTTTISGTGVSGVDAGCLVLAHAGPINLGAINATNNTYVRGTTTTQLTSAIAWSGAGGLRLGAATGTTATFSGAISVSSGTLTAILFGRSNNPDLGTVVLGATNTFTAPTQIDFGTLRISADANLGTAPGVATAAYLIVGGNTTLATTATFTLNANRGIALGPSSGSGTGTIDVASATTLTYAGIVANNSTGTGTLVKANTGTLVLNSANTYTGGTNIGAGTLKCNHVNALNTTGTVTLTSSAATLQTATSGQVNQNGKLTVAALNNGAGGIIKIGG